MSGWLLAYLRDYEKSYHLAGELLRRTWWREWLVSGDFWNLAQRLPRAVEPCLSGSLQEFGRGSAHESIV